MAEQWNIPTKDQIDKLPLNARVQFACRCARRVQPLFTHSWQVAPQKHRNAVEAAISYAEAVPSNKPWQGSLVGIERDAYAAAAAAADARSRPAADAANAAASAAVAASAATQSRRLVTVSASREAAFERVSEHVARAAINAANAALSALTATEFYKVEQAIAADFRVLVALAKSSGWKDYSPVPPDLLGPLWPIGMPWWAASQKAQEANTVGSRGGPEASNQVTLHLPLPPATDSPEVRELVINRLRGLVHALSEAYIAAGGSGLVVRQAELHVECPADCPAPTGGGDEK